MEPTRTRDGVRVGGNARQRLHEARGYGELVDTSDVLLAPVEAAYLLYRDDLASVDGKGLNAFLREEETPSFFTQFLVYKDLRERGYYLSPRSDRSDFVVFERGSTPADGHVEFNVRVIDERRLVRVDRLEPGVLAMVDEEGEVGYAEVAMYAPDGDASPPDARGIPADLVGNRVVVWEPPASIYERCFFGQPVAGREARDETLQVSLVEAVYLAEHGVIDIDLDRLADRGRTIEGTSRFDARARIYRALREAGTVPKTGFKFGADFRIYHDFDGIDRMGHSEVLVRILDQTTHIDPAAIALDVRLAHGVGKRMVFALPGDSDSTTTSWLSVTRITP